MWPLWTSEAYDFARRGNDVLTVDSRKRSIMYLNGSDYFYNNWLIGVTRQVFEHGIKRFG